MLTALAARLGSTGTLLNLPTVGDALGEPLTTDLSASDLVALGWSRFRASRTLHCRLGGAPATYSGQWELIGSEENRQDVDEFLGRSAPLAPDPASEWSAGLYDLVTPGQVGALVGRGRVRGGLAVAAGRLGLVAATRGIAAAARGVASAAVVLSDFDASPFGPRLPRP